MVTDCIMHRFKFPYFCFFYCNLYISGWYSSYIFSFYQGFCRCNADFSALFYPFVPAQADHPRTKNGSAGFEKRSRRFPKNLILLHE